MDLSKKASQLAFRRFVRLESGSYSMSKYIGIDAFMLRKWIESMWSDGMNWDNYGEYWVVDHVVPIRFFNLKDEKDLYLCWNYKNLLPLLKEDNSKKHGSVYFAFILLSEMRKGDYYYNQLYERVLVEVGEMSKYIDKYKNGNLS